MLITVEDCWLQLVQGDITLQEVDAIANAANERLAGGGGVDGAIHRAAGPTLMEETSREYPDGCPTGEAVATSAGSLTAQFVFHTVGPVWRGGGAGEEQLLRGCYRSCLELAVDHELQSVAFPAISTGVFGYPIDLAAEASLDEVRQFLETHRRPSLVRFVLWSEGNFGAYARVLEEMVS
ncbi:MAG: O-acetyl-ADP-ribose deacetylase [Planctomycetaceae bacterium]|jgi:O-acetyl-ADP-ribose deacetylase (regulator of RNase III)|nr:O-acetyl-ADP-ribose deacetylase [Planctomycetaceae bacterium]|tara:strand:+ start:367 stop:906 length:540 start_codon:yes stop_codon:yes gene_type:complete